MHYARARSIVQHSGLEAAARERWHAGQPARNHFERDVYRTIGAGIPNDHPRRWSQKERERELAAQSARESQTFDVRFTVSMSVDAADE